MADFREMVLDSLDSGDLESVVFDNVTGTDVVEGKKDNKEKKGAGDAKGIFICDEKGNKPKGAGKDLFKLLNERAGLIFTMDEDTGEISLKKDSTSSKVVPNGTQSKSLAALIENNIGANAKQQIKLRVGDGLDNGSVIFDQYATGLVDYDDVKFNGLTTFKNAAQASIFYHFLYERISTSAYEDMVNNGKYDERAFNVLHNSASQAEAVVWNEMMNDTVSSRIDPPGWSLENPKDMSKEKGYQFRGIYYDNKVILIKQNIRTKKIQFSQFISP